MYVYLKLQRDRFVIARCAVNIKKNLGYSRGLIFSRTNFNESKKNTFQEHYLAQIEFFYFFLRVIIW